MDARTIRIRIKRGSRRSDSAAASAEGSVWRALTAWGNRAYETGDHSSARPHYDAALVEAERLFDVAAAGPISEPVAVIYNVSCHNLAELLERSGDGDGAEALLKQAFEKLLASAKSPQMPLPLRLACAQNLKHALTAFVVSLTRRHAPEHQIAELVERAKATAFAVFRAAEYVDLASVSNSDRGGFPPYRGPRQLPSK